MNRTRRTLIYIFWIAVITACIICTICSLGQTTAEAIGPEPPVKTDPIVVHPKLENPIPITEFININNLCYREYIRPEPRYGFTDDEIYLLAQLLCGDASIDGDGEYDFVWDAYHSTVDLGEVSKVLTVVMNRVNSDDFPDNVTDVVMADGQFRAMDSNYNTSPDTIAIKVVREWCEAYDRGDPGALGAPETHLYFEAGENLTNVTREWW